MIDVPDLLSHVLVGYCLGTLLAVRYERLQPAHVTLVMVGALSPDFVKVQLLVPDGLVASILGVPFAWSPLHTVGGSLLVICLGALLIAPAQRRLALALFALGATSHHVLDAALLTATGEAYAVFWPLTEYRLPAADLYLSSDRWPALVSGLAAILAWLLDRRRNRSLENRSAS